MPYSKLAIAALAVAVTGAGALGLGTYRVHAYGGFHGHGRHHALFAKFIDFAVNEKLDEIQGSVGQVTRIVSEIAASAKEQAAAIDQLNQLIVVVGSQTQENVSGSLASSATAAELSGQAQGLTQMVASFKLSEEAGEGEGEGDAPLAAEGDEPSLDGSPAGQPMDEAMDHQSASA